VIDILRELDRTLAAVTAGWKPPTGLRDWYEDITPIWITPGEGIDSPAALCRPRVWAMSVCWSAVEMARVDISYRAEGAFLKLAIDLDEFAYKGLLNHPRAGCLTLDQPWAEKDEGGIANDIDRLILLSDEQNARCAPTVGRSTVLLLPIPLYADLFFHRCSIPWEGALLSYVETHNLYYHLHQERLQIYPRRHVTSPLLYARATVGIPVSRPRWTRAIEHKNGSVSSELWCLMAPVVVGRPTLLREVKGV
jgi:hypothetical protein